MEYVLIGCRSLLVLIFVMSAASKLRSRTAYAEFVTAAGRLSPRPVRAATARRLAAAVIAGELAIVLLLLVPATVPVGFAVAAAALLAFTGAILLAMRRTQRIPCRCFGSSSQPLGYTHVARNLGLLAVATLGAVGGLSWTAPPELAGALVAIVTGGVVAVLVITLDEIAALFRPVRS